MDIETYIFFLNGIFLNITTGSHLNVSSFKEMDEITVLPVNFFNKLLEYRTICEQAQLKGESYADWYSKNFGRSHEIAASCQQSLQECFSDGESRILDLFMDIPQDAENKYITHHFQKLDKDLAYIVKASKTTDILTNSITFMNTLRQMEEQKKQLKKNNALLGGDSTKHQTVQHESYLPPYLLINKNALMNSNEAIKANNGMYKDAHNERAQRQEEIERRLVGQLGDRYKDAKLIEVSEGSYLIQNHVKLPLFGSKKPIYQRTKTNFLKGPFLKSKGLFNQADIKKYVLDMARQQLPT